MPGHLQRQPSGAYRLTVSAGLDPFTGKYKQVRKTFRGTKKQAEKELALLVAQVHRGELTGTSGTVSDLLHHYLAQLDLEPAVVKDYRSLADRFIVPSIGKVNLDRLSAETLDRFYRTLDFGPERVRKVHTVVSGALAQGKRWGIVRENVARYARPPSLEHKKRTIPTDAEIRLVRKACAHDPDFSVLLELELATGARPAELCALRWENVNLNSGTITISEARASDRKSVKSTKTRDVRRLPLSPSKVKLLKAYRRRSTGEYVFGWRSDHLSKRWRFVREAAGVDFRFYDLRHYVASKLAEAGYGPEVIAYFLGHKRISTSMDIYTHVRPARVREAASVLDLA